MASDSSIALSIINELYEQLTTLVRAVLTAVADKKITAWEGIRLSMRGSTLVTYVLTMLEGMTSETRDDIFACLEHGDWHIDEEAGVDHGTALSILNELHDQLATVTRATLEALADKKITAWEGIRLVSKGATLVTYLVTMLDGVDAETKTDLLVVLEHGRWILAEV